MNRPQHCRRHCYAIKSFAALTLIAATASIGLAQAAPLPPDGAATQAPPPPGGPPRGGSGLPGGPGMGGPGAGGMGMPGGPGMRGGRGMAGGPAGRGGPGARPERLQPAVDLTGTLDGVNYSPRGDVDGFMLKMSDKSAQINLPPGLGLAVSQISPGSSLKVSAHPEPARPEAGQADHPIYVLATLTTEQGKKISAPGEGDEKFIHEESTIKRLNYARHGEVDGAQLENGDFVHLGPAARDLKLSVGQKILVDGPAHPMLTSDHQAIHAVAIDGKTLHQAPPPPGEGLDAGPGPRGCRGPGPRVLQDGGPGPQDGPRGPGGAGPRGGNDAPPPPPGPRADDGRDGQNPQRPDAPQAD